MNKADVVVELKTGTVEEARALRNVPQPRWSADHPVNGAMIKQYCALTEDANPSYWDDGLLSRYWGGDPSPAGALMVWRMPLPWTPDRGSMRGPASLGPQIPLPGSTLTNVSTKARFFRQILVGEQLSVFEQLLDVSDLKQTHLGLGHFVTTLTTYCDEADTAVAEMESVLLRYEPGSAGMQDG